MHLLLSIPVTPRHVSSQKRKKENQVTCQHRAVSAVPVGVGSIAEFFVAVAVVGAHFVRVAVVLLHLGHSAIHNDRRRLRNG